MSSVLAVDLAAHAGYAYHEAGRLEMFGEVWNTGKTDYRTRRFVTAHEYQRGTEGTKTKMPDEEDAWLTILCMLQPRLIVLERAFINPRKKFLQGSIGLLKLQGRFQSYAQRASKIMGFQYGISYVSPGTWREFIAKDLHTKWPKHKIQKERTRLLKAHSQALVDAHYGLKVDDNASDAILIGRWGTRSGEAHADDQADEV